MRRANLLPGGWEYVAVQQIRSAEEIRVRFSRHDDDEVGGRDDENPLTLRAGCGDDAARQRPPQISVIGRIRAERPDVRHPRLRAFPNPPLGYHLRAAPAAAVENQLTDLRHVARP